MKKVIDILFFSALIIALFVGLFVINNMNNKNLRPGDPGFVFRSPSGYMAITGDAHGNVPIEGVTYIKTEDYGRKLSTKELDYYENKTSVVVE